MRMPRWFRVAQSKPVTVKRTRVRQAAYARSKGVRFAEWPKTPPTSDRETFDDEGVRRRMRH